ncbi:hypothetical protein ACH4E7_35745 [Kitasatospora sp. NPDC018058]|uniref:hypothetical protein n=1 Tax=Kitasatospora sp. NPDC018058 TaxID=3364025 RepID=UPI0037C03BBE
MAGCESEEVARRFIQGTVAKQGVDEGELTIHSGRGRRNLWLGTLDRLGLGFDSWQFGCFPGWSRGSSRQTGISGSRRPAAYYRFLGLWT